MTFIKCEECKTEFRASDFSIKNAADACTCRNIQLIVCMFSPPAKHESYLTVQYTISPPVIYEIREEKIKVKQEEEPLKKIGFN